jgi:hypothetical protein
MKLTILQNYMKPKQIVKNKKAGKCSCQIDLTDHNQELP